MSIQFSTRPGTHERQQKRKHNNPLFDDFDSVTADSVEAARKKDEQAYHDFIAEFEKLVEDILALPPQAETQDILDLKARLDQAFEASCILPGDLEPIHDAIQKLIAPMMQAIYKNAQNDPVALGTLEEEDNARALHWSLLENPLIADLLIETSAVQPEELTATLLSEHEALLKHAMELLSPEQLNAILDEATDKLDRLEQSGRSSAFAMPQLNIIKNAAKNADATADIDSNAEH